jgi:ABC-2 type transport system ATP-binding protein
MIVARALTKRYLRTVAVDDLSFEVTPGVVTGFLGPNGSGKSTTMRMIMGLDNPTSGTALVNGKKLAELKWPLREVGALLDAKAFHPARSAYNHLLFLAQSNDIPRARIDEVLEIVGLTSVAHQRAGRYSLGMGQRLGIAGALLGNPGVLLFDEPINGLDPEGIRWVRYLLRDLAAEGRTVFVSSHLINEMSLTAERLVVIGRGTLIAETSVSAFTAQSALDAVRVVTPMTDRFVSALHAAGATVTMNEDGSILASGMTSAQIGDLATDRVLTVHELSPVRGSLEDAFMELTRDSVEFRTKPNTTVASPSNPSNARTAAMAGPRSALRTVPDVPASK